MTWKSFPIAAAVLLAAGSWTAAAELQIPTPDPQVQEGGEDALSLSPASGWFQPSSYDFIRCGPLDPRRDVAVRFGWWGTSTDGSPVKVGEWQDLSPSPFWDVDGLMSDGFSTTDFFANGLDQEANQAGFYYFRPGFSADVDYERFIRRKDHIPLTNFGAMDSDLPVVGEDLNVGEDYAIRVQEFEAAFKGRVTDNVGWRLDLWGMRKQGDRQLNSPAHCQSVPLDGEEVSRCHVISQKQRIDWLTMEIKPVLEGRWGPFSVEYSRPMRAFTQDDQVAMRSYNHFGVFDQEEGGPFANEPVAVGWVPDNFTQIDQLKLGWDINCDNKAYALLWNGNTENQHREMNRHFYGYDLRLTNCSLDGLKMTGYVKKKVELNETPPFFLSDQGEPVVDPASIGVTPEEMLGGIRFSDVRHPVDYDRNQVGVRARWNPFEGAYWADGWALTGEYRYSEIERSYVTYVIGDSDFPTRQPLQQRLDEGTSRLFTIPNTHSNIFKVGTEKRWSACLDTYLRYTMEYTDDPLVGLRLSDETYVETGDPSYMTNTNQPEHQDLVQLGGTWTPAYNFLLTGWVGLETRHTNSEYAHFDENNYPIVFTAWYAPAPRWSLSGGLGYYTNWIDQDITVGFRNADPAAGERFPAFTEQWDYTGRAQVYNVGTSFAWTPRVILKGELEWVRGKNQFFAPSPAGTDLSQLPYFSDVIVQTTRISAGVDWLITSRFNTYFRYVYFDYEDESVAYNSGTANFFLAGVAATF